MSKVDVATLIALVAAVVVVIVATAALARGEAASMAASSERRISASRVPLTASDVGSALVAAATSQP